MGELLLKHGLNVGPSSGATGYLADEIAASTGPDAVVAFISACGRPVSTASAAATTHQTSSSIAHSRSSIGTFGRGSPILQRPRAGGARQQRMVHTEAAMAEKGIVLPAYQDAMWSYVKGMRDGNLLYIGDHVGQDENAVTVRGKVGEGGAVTQEAANKLAGQAALRLLSTASHYLDGDLDRIDQVIKLTGIVNGVPDFQGHGKVVDGASDMFFEVLGDRGKHARTCIGAGSCPAAVTVEVVIRIKDGY